jgi:lysozyme family protein
MKENFTKSLGFVFRWECAFAPGHDNDSAFVICEDVPGDNGGLTKWGIDQADHPGVDIRNLTLDQAASIYHDGEWTACRCDDLPEKIDTFVFDTAVNNGVAVAGILLQRALQFCAFSLECDGDIGTATIRAALAQSNVAPRGGGIVTGTEELLDHLFDARRRRYEDIVLHHPGDAKFLRGWLNRVNDLETILKGRPA